MEKLAFEQVEDARQIVWETLVDLQNCDTPSERDMTLMREVSGVHDQLSVLLRRIEELAISFNHTVHKIATAQEFIQETAEHTPAEKDVVMAFDSVVQILKELSGDTDEPDDTIEVQILRCWVFGDDGNVYVQEPEENQWGFSLTDGENTWAGGLVPGLSSWESIEEDDPRITQEHRDAMEWLFDELPSPDH